MSDPIGIRTTFVVMVPTVALNVPNGSLFLDSAQGNQPTIKGTGGVLSQVGGSAIANILIKQMETAGAIALNQPLSKRADGKIVAADSDAAEGQNIIGYALEVSVQSGDMINVLLLGPNIVDALLGLGFVPGQEIYLSQTGGFTNDPGTFTDNNDSIIKLGIADCAGGAASSEAKDLIVFSEVITRPIT